MKTGIDQIDTIASTITDNTKGIKIYTYVFWLSKLKAHVACDFAFWIIGAKTSLF